MLCARKGSLQHDSAPGLPVAWRHCGNASVSKRVQAPEQAPAGCLARWPAHPDEGYGTIRVSQRRPHLLCSPDQHGGGLQSLQASANTCRALFPHEQSTQWLSCRVLHFPEASLRMLMVPGSAGPHSCSTLGGGWLHGCGSASRLGFGMDVTCPFPTCSRLIIISRAGDCFARDGQTQLLTSCWLSLPDPTQAKLLFAMGLPWPVQRVGGLGSDLLRRRCPPGALLWLHM